RRAGARRPRPAARRGAGGRSGGGSPRRSSRRRARTARERGPRRPSRARGRAGAPPPTAGPPRGAPPPSARAAPPRGGVPAAAPAAIRSKTSVAEEVANSLDGAVDVLVRVRKRDEQALELRGRDVDAALEQVPEQGAVPLRVARLR